MGHWKSSILTSSDRNETENENWVEWSQFRTKLLWCLIPTPGSSFSPPHGLSIHITRWDWTLINKTSFWPMKAQADFWYEQRVACWVWLYQALASFTRAELSHLVAHQILVASWDSLETSIKYERHAFVLLLMKKSSQVTEQIPWTFSKWQATGREGTLFLRTLRAQQAQLLGWGSLSEQKRTSWHKTFQTCSC